MKVRITPPAVPVNNVLTIGGSKSISNRILIIRHLSESLFQLRNCSDSEDTVLLANALENIEGDRFDINHAGTSFRFLTALFSVLPGTRTLTGSTRLQERPVDELVSVMRQLGADIRYLEKEGFAPLEITGRSLDGGQTDIRGDISSQFISALLLIAPYLKNGLRINLTSPLVSAPYVDMTIGVMKEFGVDVTKTASGYEVNNGKYTFGHPDFTIESDWSSAGYWYAMASLSPGSKITLNHFSESSLQADSRLSEVFRQLGVETEFNKTGMILSNTGISEQEEIRQDLIDFPDTTQTIAVVLAAKGIKSHLTGLQTLKLKETNRIEALENELSKFGIKVTATENSIAIEGKAVFSREAVKTYHDHRMAMSFAPLSLTLGEVLIEDPDVVSKSYPNFWEDLASAGFGVAF